MVGYTDEHLDREVGDQYRPSWFWFVGAGAALTVLGALAFGHLAVSSIVSTFIIGLFMLLGGWLGLAHAIGIRHPDKHHFWMFSAFFYSTAGFLILVEPLVGLRVLTLGVAVALGLSGISRLVVGAQLQGTAILVSGASSLIAAAVIGIDWPRDSLWVIGFIVAIDLIAQGVSLTITGMTLHLSARHRAA